MQHLFWAMINALWQSAAIAVTVGAALRFIPRTTAAQRYALWCAVLVAAALLPIADLAMPSRTIALPVNAPPAPVIARVVSEVVPVSVATTPIVTSLVPAVPSRTLPNPLLLIWLGIAATLLVRLTFAYASLRTVKSSLEPSDDLTARVQEFSGVWSRHAVVGVSPQVAEPCAIGFFHPAIALSSEMAATLPDGDLERVLRHEYAHVRRYDDYANLMQRVFAAVLWFNPVVHIAGRAMAIEREIACDDAAAAASDERVAFARCLYEIARTAPRRRHAAAAGFIGSRRQIAVRVARLVERNHNASTRLGSFAKITAITVLALALALAGVHLTALAVPQSAPLLPVAASPEPPTEKPLTRVEPAQKLVVPKAKAMAKTVVVTKTVKVVQTHTVERVAVATAPPSPQPNAPVIAPTPLRYHYHSRTMGRSGPDLMDALVDAGFRNLSVDDLIMLANRGVGSQLIAELHARGLTPMPASSLARLADSGVTGEYIGGLAQLGYANLPIEDYVRLRNAGVTLEFVQRLQRSGLINGRATVEQLIKLANAGV
jgi:beta-lactamase regulating signal transducer with metallopeptidase domain